MPLMAFVAVNTCLQCAPLLCGLLSLDLDVDGALSGRPCGLFDEAGLDGVLLRVAELRASVHRPVRKVFAPARKKSFRTSQDFFLAGANTLRTGDEPKLSTLQLEEEELRPVQLRQKVYMVGRPEIRQHVCRNIWKPCIFQPVVLQSSCLL